MGLKAVVESMGFKDVAHSVELQVRIRVDEHTYIGTGVVMAYRRTTSGIFSYAVLYRHADGSYRVSDCNQEGYSSGYALVKNECIARHSPLFRELNPLVTTSYGVHNG